MGDMLAIYRQLDADCASYRDWIALQNQYGNEAEVGTIYSIYNNHIFSSLKLLNQLTLNLTHLLFRNSTIVSCLSIRIMMNNIRTFLTYVTWIDPHCAIKLYQNINLCSINSWFGQRCVPAFGGKGNALWMWEVVCSKPRWGFIVDIK